MLFNRTELRRKSDIVSGAGDLYRGKEKEDIIIHQDRRCDETCMFEVFIK